MKKIKKWLGRIIGIWTILAWLPDALEKCEATVKYGKWLYMHIGGGHISVWLWKIVVPLIGLGIILSDPIQKLVYWLVERSRGGPSSPMEKLEDRALYERSKAWLEKHLADKKLEVESAILFGSVVHNHFPTTDVDVLVVLKNASDKASARAGQRVKDLRKEFLKTFNHRLDVQLFLSKEEEGLKEFLSKLNKYEWLTLR